MDPLEELLKGIMKSDMGYDDSDSEEDDEEFQEDWNCFLELVKMEETK